MKHRKILEEKLELFKNGKIIMSYKKRKSRSRASLEGCLLISFLMYSPPRRLDMFGKMKIGYEEDYNKSLKKNNWIIVNKKNEIKKIYYNSGKTEENYSGYMKRLDNGKIKIMMNGRSGIFESKKYYDEKYWELLNIWIYKIRNFNGSVINFCNTKIGAVKGNMESYTTENFGVNITINIYRRIHAMKTMKNPNTTFNEKLFSSLLKAHSVATEKDYTTSFVNAK